MGKAQGQGIEYLPNGQVRHDGLWFEDEPISHQKSIESELPR
jgi:hypothetical protein